MKDTTAVRPRRGPKAARRFGCMGFCGGGAGFYARWVHAVPPGVELAAVCCPGREGRFAEDWGELVDDTLDAVFSAVDEERGGPAPETLVVSSANAPSRGLTAAGMFPSQRDSDAQLLTWVKEFGLIPDHVLGSPDLQEMAVELMRADPGPRLVPLPGRRGGEHVLPGAHRRPRRSHRPRWHGTVAHADEGRVRADSRFTVPEKETYAP